MKLKQWKSLKLKKKLRSHLLKLMLKMMENHQSLKKLISKKRERLFNNLSNKSKKSGFKT